MDIKNLTRLFEHPESIDAQHVSSLKEVVKEFPYFTAAQVLLAVGMTRDGHEDAAIQLRKAAAMAPDRNMLRKLSARGDTVIVIEHHPDIIRLSDWKVELGPVGGSEGGCLLKMGPND